MSRQGVLLKQRISLGLFVVAFASALHFYGVGYNHLFLLGTSLCAMISITLLGPGLAHQAFSSRPMACSLALLSLLMLVIQQNFFSINYETSFSETWVLAAAPLWFLIVVTMASVVTDASSQRVASQIPAVYLLVVCAVALMVFISAVLFLWFDVRPHEPLVDTSNFGSMVYLTLVPATHWWLTVSATKEPLRSKGVVVDCLFGVLFLLSSVSVWATQSRACTWLLALAVIFWVALGLFGRVALTRSLVVAGLFVGGFLLAGSGPGAPELSVPQEFVADASIEERFMLTDAGLELAQQYAPWGSGAYTFGMLYPTVRSELEQASGGRFVHNDYVQLAAEGGVLFLLPLLLFVLAVFWNGAMGLAGSKHGPQPATARYFGGWMALAMVLTHALVNYVFYTLAIGMLIGVVSAWALNTRTVSSPNPDVPKRRSRGFLFGWLGTVGFGWLCLFYLVLDNTDLAVFSGQLGVPGASALRTDVAAQARYAALSHDLNSDRSLPLLVVALQAKSELSRNPDQAVYRKSKTAFQSALAVNPWNTDAYLQYANLVLEHEPRWSSATQARTIADELLEQALAHTPLDLTLLQRKAQRLTQTQGPRPAFDWLMQHAFPWLDYFSVQSRERTLTLVEDLGRRSLALEDRAAFERIRDARAKVLQAQERSEPPVWLMRWRQSRSLSSAGG